MRSYQDGVSWGLHGDMPALSDTIIVAIIRNLCEIAQEGWLSEELLRHDAGQIAGWIVLGMSTEAGQF
jgi:hypothetical protein